MIDVRLLRSDPGSVRLALARRGKPDVLDQLDEAERHDARLREITVQRDSIRGRVTCRTASPTLQRSPIKAAVTAGMRRAERPPK